MRSRAPETAGRPTLVHAAAVRPFELPASTARTPSAMEGRETNLGHSFARILSGLRDEDAPVLERPLSMAASQPEEPIPSGGPPQHDGQISQRKFDGDGAWMQQVNNTTLTARFGPTTRALWSALRDVAPYIQVVKGGSGASYDVNNSILTIAGDWHDAVKDYVDNDTKTAKATRGTSALTHELSHAHDQVVRHETQRGKSKTDDSYVTAVLKTELKAWMKEARSARENIKDKGMTTSDDDNKVVFSWVAVRFLLNEGTDILTVVGSENKVVGRLKKYFRDNKSTNTQTTLDQLLADQANGLAQQLDDYSTQIRNKFTTNDTRLRKLVWDADYMK